MYVFLTCQRRVYNIDWFGSQRALGPNYVESWTYGACLEIVKLCEQSAADANVDASTMTTFSALKAELLDLARIQVAYSPPNMTAAIDAVSTCLSLKGLASTLAICRTPIHLT